MKKILKNLMFGLMVAAGAIFSSCSTTDEVMDSIPYNRVLTPLNFSATVVASTGTDVTFRWDLMQNAEAYELQIFESDSEPDYDTAEPVESYLVEMNEVPYTVSLVVDNTYYARVRGISSRIEASNWAYPDKRDRSVKTYAVRASLNPVIVSRSETELTIGWDDADDKADLTFVSVAKVLDSKNSENIDLSAADIENCSLTVSDLEPGTQYKLTLIFGKAGERGYVTAWTRPEVDQFVKVSTAADIVSIIEGATGEVRLLVAYNEGEEYDFTEALADPANPGGVLALKVGCDLTLIGDEAVDGKKPVLKNLELSLVKGVTKVHLENLSMNGNNKSGGAVTLSADEGGMVPDHLSAVEFINCEFYDYTKAIYSSPANEKYTTDVDYLLISGVYAHDINAKGANGGDFIDMRNTGTHAKIDVINSTFYACARTFLRVSDKAKNNTVNVENCTFNFVTATDTSSNNAGIFHVRTDITGTQSITCSNCLFMNMFNENDEATTAEDKKWIRIARNNATESGAPACENNYYYHVGQVFLTTKAVVPQTGEQFSAEGWTELTEDPCINSDAGKLYLTNPVIAEKQVGDPRWWNATQPKVERATELETVTETTVWDFTDKTKYDTESIEDNTIIQNIRIYAPAEIVMGKGVTFAAAAELGSNGRPTSNALGFKAEGYGSVTVATLDGGYNATVNVVVGEDRITLPADGTAHKAVFGDLKGENEIFVLAGSAVTITSVTWTAEDAEAEDTKKALAAPAVKLSVASFEEGNEEGIDVVASWAAVENADKYEVTFKGQTVETSETSFTISADEAAALAVGEYEITVTAYPVASSSKYKASEATTVSFKVKEKPLPGGTKVLDWNFSDAAFDSISKAIGTSDNSTYSGEYEGLSIVAGGKSIKIDSIKSVTTYIRGIRLGGAGSKTERVLSFDAPYAGTLKVWSSGTSSSSMSSGDRNIVVADSAKTHDKQDGNGLTVAPVELTFDDVAAGKVYIYSDGGVDVFRVQFTYTDPDAAAGAEPLVWNFSEIFKAKADLCSDAQEYKLNDDGTVSVTTETTAKETLYFSPNSKKISIENRKSDSGNSYFGFKYGGQAAYAYINVDTPGTLTVEAVASGEAGNNTLRIDVNGVKGTQIKALNAPNTTDDKCGIKEYEFELEGITELSKVAIMKNGGDNSPEIYSITWTPAN